MFPEIKFNLLYVLVMITNFGGPDIDQRLQNSIQELSKSFVGHFQTSVVVLLVISYTSIPNQSIHSVYV